MIDVKQPLRTAYMTLLGVSTTTGLSSVLGIPVSDSMEWIPLDATTYVIFTSQNSQSNNTQNSWMSNEQFTLDIVTKGVRVSKKTIDDIASLIYGVLFPGPNRDNGLNTRTDILIHNARVTDDRYMNFKLTGGVSVMRRLITVTQLVTQ